YIIHYLFTPTPSSEIYTLSLHDALPILAYAFFNQWKDSSKPMWVVGIDYTAPTAEALDPTVGTSMSARGKLGDSNHKYKFFTTRSEEHTSELQSRSDLVCRLLLEKKKKI